MEACRRCNNELSSAHPDLGVLKQFVLQYSEAIDYFAHSSMLKPLRYIPKAYDHILRWHMLEVAEEMQKDQALRLGAVGSGALEHLSKFLKGSLRQNQGGGRQDTKHEYANDRLVRTFIALSADLRCMRQRFYVEQQALKDASGASEAPQ